MATREIVVIVGADGAVKVDAMGYSGPDCERATKALRDALGQVTGHVRKADYSRPSLGHVGQSQQVRG